MRNFLSILVLVLFVSNLAFAQDDDKPSRSRSRIINDSTKQVYGPRTSKYFFERDVFFNRDIKYEIDTAIRNFHRYGYVQRYQYLFQDLGHLGTAIRPMYYSTPDVIGKTSGNHVYDLYWDEESIRYFDTKSSYSNMKVVLGGRGRSITKAVFSRNINSQWNVGVDYRGMLVDKNLQRAGKADRQIRDYYYDAYTTYKSKDSTYRIFANIRRGYHRVLENGGVRPVSSDFLTEADIFAANAQPWLTSSNSSDMRITAHVFQQYSLGKGLQVYHTFDRTRQRALFFDTKNSANDPYFSDYAGVESDTISDAQKFKTVRNEVGVKGSLGKLFYNGYYAIRHYSMSLPNLRNQDADHVNFSTLQVEHLGNENYLGGNVSLFLDSIGEVNGHAEVGREGSAHNYYKLQGEIKSRWFEARLTQMQYAPGLVQQFYRGGYNEWNNNFANVNSTQFQGALHYRSKVLSVSPGLTFTRLSNYVFYKKVSNVDTVQWVTPVQSTGQQVMLSPQVNASLTLYRHITVSGQAIYTKFAENADSAFAIPKLFVNAQIAYANIFFNGNFDIHTGVDLHWQSSYNAMAYDVALRQFYIQNTKQVPAFPIIDLFLNAKVKRGRIFFKYHNMMQAFTKKGYQFVPFYPGQPNTFEFGFDWSFYD